MPALEERIEELRGLHIRLHVAPSSGSGRRQGRGVTTIDGTCQGVEDDCIILAPSSLGERTDVLLERICAVTQLGPGAGEVATDGDAR